LKETLKIAGLHLKPTFRQIFETYMQYRAPKLTSQLTLKLLTKTKTKTKTKIYGMHSLMVASREAARLEIHWLNINCSQPLVFLPVPYCCRPNQVAPYRLSPSNQEEYVHLETADSPPVAPTFSRTLNRFREIGLCLVSWNLMCAPFEEITSLAQTCNGIGVDLDVSMAEIFHRRACSTIEALVVKGDHEHPPY
jgi:hypothetical protein